MNETSLNQRKGLLSILLHQTIVHNNVNEAELNSNNHSMTTNTNDTEINQIIQANTEAQIRA